MTDLEIRFSGAGGQGLQLAAKLLSAMMAEQGRRASLSQAYEPTSRGGLSRADVVISENAEGFPLVTALDYLVILDQIAVPASEGLIGDNTVVIVDESKVPNPPGQGAELHRLPLIQMALDAGTVRAANVVSLAVLGAVSGLCGEEELVRHVSAAVPERFRNLNIAACRAGFACVSVPALQVV